MFSDIDMGDAFCGRCGALKRKDKESHEWACPRCGQANNGAAKNPGKKPSLEELIFESLIKNDRTMAMLIKNNINLTNLTQHYIAATRGMDGFKIGMLKTGKSGNDMLMTYLTNIAVHPHLLYEIKQHFSHDDYSVYEIPRDRILSIDYGSVPARYYVYAKYKDIGPALIEIEAGKSFSSNPLKSFVIPTREFVQIPLKKP